RQGVPGDRLRHAALRLGLGRAEPRAASAEGRPDDRRRRGRTGGADLLRGRRALRGLHARPLRAEDRADPPDSRAHGEPRTLAGRRPPLPLAQCAAGRPARRRARPRPTLPARAATRLRAPADARAARLRSAVAGGSRGTARLAARAPSGLRARDVLPPAAALTCRG